jgi:hypothetical protein
MKIRLSELRRMIRQVIVESNDELNEMPFKAVTKTLVQPGAEKFMVDPKKERLRKVKKFHSGSKFKKDAEWAFRFFDQDIIVVPLFPNHYMNPEKRTAFHDKTNVMGGTAVLDVMINKGIIPDDPDVIPELRSALDGGATVVFTKSTGVGRGIMPSVWMIFHAMFDSNIIHDKIDPIKKQLIPLVNRMWSLSGAKYLTMGSTRSEDGISDAPNAVSEIMTQAALDSRGFNFKLPDPKSPNAEEITNILNEIKDVLKDLRENVHKIMSNKKGKIIVVSTANLSPTEFDIGDR